MRTRPAAIVISLAIIIASCAAPPKQKIDSIYTGLQELLPRFDPAILAGRTIVIDPGHGGFFSGTTGAGGLEEASVNLGVALYLGGLLREAGATVHFTRSADRDFLTPQDSSLTVDLARRSALVDSVRPDVFVSIHHNAQNLRDPETNAVETYYKFGDPASHDLAIAVHRHLMRNLGIGTGEVKQGNYYVLRTSSVPAILGEASYLTNPATEGQLRLSEKQKLEAEAYYLGILDYFRRGTPRITFAAPRETTLAAVPDLRYTVDDIGGVGIDPDAILLTINDEPAAASSGRDGHVVAYSFPWDTPNGRYTAALQVRNLMGNSSMRSTRSFTIDLPPVLSLFEHSPAPPPPGWGPVRVRAVLLDARGLRVADGSIARIFASSTADSVAVLPSTTPVSNGRLECYIDPAGDPDSIALTVECRGRSFHHTIKRGGAAAAASRSLRRVTALDGATRQTVAGVSVLYRDSVITTGSDDGILLIPGEIDAAATLVCAPGYRPLLEWDAADSLFLEPWFARILHGKKFVLDPQGGGRATAGIGPLGLPAAHVNLQVARHCASFLRQAGATVMLTRTSEESPTPQDIVAMANRFGADRYIEIRHRHGSPDETPVGPSAVRTYCFPGSRLGAIFAEQMARSFGDYFALVDAAAGTQVTYPLQQTACPAIIVEAPAVDDPDEEIRLGEPWYLRKQAYALFLGILDHFTVPDHGELVVQIDTGDDDKANWLVTLDESWNLLTDPSGAARFEALQRGSHTLSVRKQEIRLLREIDIESAGRSVITIVPAAERR